MNTRKLIIEATMRMIRQRGLAKVTTKEIAREAGCSEGTLYRHFVRKEDVFIVIIQQHLLVSFEHFETDTILDPLHIKLEKMAYIAIDYYQHVIPLTSAFFADTDLLLRFREVLAQDHAISSRLCDQVTIVLQHEQESGYLSPHITPLDAALLLVGACFQYVFFQQFLGQNLLLEEQSLFVNNLIHSLMTGLQPRIIPTELSL